MSKQDIKLLPDCFSCLLDNLFLYIEIKGDLEIHHTFSKKKKNKRNNSKAPFCNISLNQCISTPTLADSPAHLYLLWSIYQKGMTLWWRSVWPDAADSAFTTACAVDPWSGSKMENANKGRHKQPSWKVFLQGISETIRQPYRPILKGRCGWPAYGLSYLRLEGSYIFRGLSVMWVTDTSMNAYYAHVVTTTGVHCNHWPSVTK